MCLHSFRQYTQRGLPAHLHDKNPLLLRTVKRAGDSGRCKDEKRAISGGGDCASLRAGAPPFRGRCRGRARSAAPAHRLPLQHGADGVHFRRAARHDDHFRDQVQLLECHGQQPLVDRLDIAFQFRQFGGGQLLARRQRDEQAVTQVADRAASPFLPLPESSRSARSSCPVPAAGCPASARAGRR